MRRALAAALVPVAVAGGGAAARADADDTLLAVGYVASLAGGALATAVNGSHLAFGEPAPRGWRIFGYAIGAVDVGWGVAALVAASDRAEGVAVGTLALAMGAGALVTAHFVDEIDDRPGVRVTALPAPGGGTVNLVGRF